MTRSSTNSSANSSPSDLQRQKENLIKQAYQQGFADGLLRHGMLKESQIPLLPMALGGAAAATAAGHNPIRAVGRWWRDRDNAYRHPVNAVKAPFTHLRNELGNAWNDRPAGSIELAAPTSKERQQFDDKSRIKAQQLRDAPAMAQLSNARGNAPEMQPRKIDRIGTPEED